MPLAARACSMPLAARACSMPLAARACSMPLAARACSMPLAARACSMPLAARACSMPLAARACSMPGRTHAIPREVSDSADEGGRKHSREGMDAGYIRRRPRGKRHGDLGNPRWFATARNHERGPQILVTRRNTDSGMSNDIGRELRPGRILLSHPAPDPENESSSCRQQEPASPTHFVSPRSRPATVMGASASRFAPARPIPPA